LVDGRETTHTVPILLIHPAGTVVAVAAASGSGRTGVETVTAVEVVEVDEAVAAPAAAAAVAVDFLVVLVGGCINFNTDSTDTGEACPCLVVLADVGADAVFIFCSKSCDIPVCPSLGKEIS
jgi:hypothetical protein